MLTHPGLKPTVMTTWKVPDVLIADSVTERVSAPCHQAFLTGRAGHYRNRLLEPGPHDRKMELRSTAGKTEAVSQLTA